jgi:hypothetical protein
MQFEMENLKILINGKKIPSCSIASSHKIVNNPGSIVVIGPVPKASEPQGANFTPTLELRGDGHRNLK